MRVADVVVVRLTETGEVVAELRGGHPWTVILNGEDSISGITDPRLDRPDADIGCARLKSILEELSEELKRMAIAISSVNKRGDVPLWKGERGDAHISLS
jgi:hypothetical protein